MDSLWTQLGAAPVASLDMKAIIRTVERCRLPGTFSLRRPLSHLHLLEPVFRAVNAATAAPTGGERPRTGHGPSATDDLLVGWPHLTVADLRTTSESGASCSAASSPSDEGRTGSNAQRRPSAGKAILEPENPGFEIDYGAGTTREHLFHFGPPRGRQFPIKRTGPGRKAKWRSKAGRPLPAADVGEIELLERALAARGAEAADVLAQFSDAALRLVDGAVGSELVARLCRAGRRCSATVLYSWMEEHGRKLSGFAFNSLMAAYAQEGLWEEAEALMAKMAAAGEEPTLFTYTKVMEAHSRAGRWQAAAETFGRLRAAGCRPDVIAYNTLLLALGRAGRLQASREQWAAMDTGGVPCSGGTYALLLSTFVRGRRLDLALEVYHRLLREGCDVTADMYQGLIGAAAAAGRWPLAVDLLAEMLAGGHRPGSARVYNGVIAAAGRRGRWDVALGVYDLLLEGGFRPDHWTWSAVVAALARGGESGRALAFHDEMLRTSGLGASLAASNAALLACQRAGMWRRGLDVLDGMLRGGVQPDVISYSTLIQACEAAGEVDTALQVLRKMEAANCAPNSHTFASIIRILGRSRDWREATNVFKGMGRWGCKANLFTYNALVFALAFNGKTAQARFYYHQMRASGIIPDVHTESILHAYCDDRIGAEDDDDGEVEMLTSEPAWAP